MHIKWPQTNMPIKVDNSRQAKGVDQLRTYLGDLMISIFGEGTGFEMGIEAGKLLREMW